MPFLRRPRPMIRTLDLAIEHDPRPPLFLIMFTAACLLLASCQAAHSEPLNCKREIAKGERQHDEQGDADPFRAAQRLATPGGEQQRSERDFGGEADRERLRKTPGTQPMGVDRDEHEIDEPTDDDRHPRPAQRQRARFIDERLVPLSVQTSPPPLTACRRCGLAFRVRFT